MNEEPISLAEFLNVMSGSRANIYSYFSSKYGVTDNVNFWKTDFNGEVPSELLLQNTISQLKRIKAEQILFKVYGIEDDISYSDFLRDFKKENKRRKIAVERKIPIYGPIQYDEKVYYDYLQSERIEKLKQLLASKELRTSEEEIIKFYSENRKEIYKNPDMIRIEKITMAITNNGEEISETEKMKREITMKQILIRMRNGEKSRLVINDFKSKGVINIEFEELMIDKSSSKMYSNLFPEISMGIKTLNFFQISDIIKEVNSLNIIKIVEVQGGSFMTYEEVKGHIMKELINDKFNRMIMKLAVELELVINEKLIRKIADSLK